MSSASDCAGSSTGDPGSRQFRHRDKRESLGSYLLDNRVLVPSDEIVTELDVPPHAVGAGHSQFSGEFLDLCIP